LEKENTKYLANSVRYTRKVTQKDSVMRTHRSNEPIDQPRLRRVLNSYDFSQYSCRILHD